MTHVVTILMLCQILRKMLRTDMDMRAVDRALERGPNALDAVRGADMRARLVADGDVAIALLAKEAVRTELVAADRCAGGNRSVNVRFHRPAGAALDNPHR